MSDAALQELDFNRHVQDLRETWQGRLLLSSGHGSFARAIFMSILAHNFDDAFFVLFRAVFPGAFIEAPFICSAAKIDKAGRIVADMVLRNDGYVRKDCILFSSSRDMEGKLRRTADYLKFNDNDRRQFFIAARNWVVADSRLDPNMDPADPDARRLVVN